MFRSLSSRLILLLAVLIIFTIVASFIPTRWIIETSQERNIQDAARRTDQVVNTQLRTQTQRLFNESQLIGVLPILATVVDDGDPPTILDTLQSYQSQLGMHIIEVYDDDGELLVTAEDNFSEKITPQSELLIENALDGQTVTTLNIRNGRLVLLGASPIGIPEDPSGVLMIGMYLNSAFAESIQSLTEAEISFVAEGRLTSSSLPRNLQLPLWNEVRRHVEDLHTLQTERFFYLDEYFVQIRPLRDAQQKIAGHLVLFFPLAEAKAILANIQYLLAAVAIGLFFMVIIVGYKVAMTIIRPLKTLQKNAEQLAEGDLEIAIDTSRNDEVGQLAQSFDTMRKAVQSLIRDLSQTNSAFERFVPSQFLGYLNKNSIVDVGLGDNVRTSMNILFSDLRSFTTISEKMTPDENFAFLNTYLGLMNPIIQENHGFIDKYIGDAIMALFDQKTDNAVKAAVSMLKTLQDNNSQLRPSGLEPIRMGIGINTGSMMLGTIGALNRMETTVISDAVNLASRIEGMTKIYGASLLISEYTFNSLRHPEVFSIRMIGRVRVKGKEKPVTVYEVLDGEPLESRIGKTQTKPQFEAALTLYHNQEIQNALQLLRECLTHTPEDKAIRIYIERCEHYLREGDQGSWDGITKLEIK